MATNSRYGTARKICPGNGGIICLITALSSNTKVWLIQLSGYRSPSTTTQVTDFCMDLDDSFKVQTWSCSGANNQVWTI